MLLIAMSILGGFSRLVIDFSFTLFLYLIIFGVTMKDALGSKKIRSASSPTLMEPFFSWRPVRRAGPADQ